MNKITHFVRFASTNTLGFTNRNPRNLELMRIARKPQGFNLEKPGRKFWHKLVLTSSSRTLSAQVLHFTNGPIVKASTTEWAMRKQLHSTKDTSAFFNLAGVFAQRCLECGITEMFCDIKPSKGSKTEMFLNELTKNGLKLEEPSVYKNPNPWDRFRPEKPWEVLE